MSSSSVALDMIAEDEVEPIHWGAMAGSTFTLINSAVSASLLTLPFAFKKAGIVQGIFFIIILGSLARFIDWRLVRYGRRFKAKTYANMIANALGDKVGVFLSVLVATALFVGLVGLLILVGDLVTPIMQYWFGEGSMLGNRTALTLLVSMLFIVPLGSLPSISMLQYSSVLTVASLIFMTISIIIRCSQKVAIPTVIAENPPILLWNWSWDIVKAFPIIWYNSGFIFQAIPVLAQRPAQFTGKRMAAIMATVTFAVAGLMIALGVPGYLTFFDHSNGNILTNYAIDDPLIGVCRALVTVVVVCSYPLFNMPLRDALFYLQAQFVQYRSRRTSSTIATSATIPIDSISLRGINPSSPTNGTFHDDMVNDTTSTSSDEATTSTDAEMVRLDLDCISINSGGFSDSETSRSPASSASSPHSTGYDLQNVIGDRVEDGDSKSTEGEHQFLSGGQIEGGKDDVAAPVANNGVFATWIRSFVQTFVCWVLAFTLAYVIPDITVIIGFVASTFSPVYYFALPGIVALSLPEGKKWTRFGGYFLLTLCGLFLISGFATYFLPKNTIYPPLPSKQNTTNAGVHQSILFFP